MTDSERSVTLTRLGKASFRVTNTRGGTLALGEGVSSDCSPVELMPAAIAGCSAIYVDYLVGKPIDLNRSTSRLVPTRFATSRGIVWPTSA